jgi:hypothetical protein
VHASNQSTILPDAVVFSVLTIAVKALSPSETGGFGDLHLCVGFLAIANQTQTSYNFPRTQDQQSPHGNCDDLWLPIPFAIAFESWHQTVERPSILLQVRALSLTRQFVLMSFDRHSTHRS